MLSSPFHLGVRIGSTILPLQPCVPISPTKSAVPAASFEGTATFAGTIADGAFAMLVLALRACSPSSIDVEGLGIIGHGASIHQKWKMPQFLDDGGATLRSHES